MTRIIIAALLTLLTYEVFAADAPNSEKLRAPDGSKVKLESGAKQGSSSQQATINTIEEKHAAANKVYYDKAAKEEGMVKTGSGLLYKSLKEGSGATPGVMSTVKVRARGTLINGKEFYNSNKLGAADQHKMNRIFRCWQEGLLKMKVGGKAKLVCLPELAFKGNGAGNVVPPNAIVTYEIELLEVKK